MWLRSPNHQKDNHRKKPNYPARSQVPEKPNEPTKNQHDKTPSQNQTGTQRQPKNRNQKIAEENAKRKKGNDCELRVKEKRRTTKVEVVSFLGELLGFCGWFACLAVGSLCSWSELLQDNSRLSSDASCLKSLRKQTEKKQTLLTKVKRKA